MPDGDLEAGAASGPEFWFYHLESRSLAQTLPELLERTLQRGWRAYVHGADDERLEALNAHLWTYAPASFLAHGLESEPNAAQQPVLLGDSGSLSNAPDVYLSVAPVNLPDSGAMASLQRCLIVFEGGDDGHLGWARSLWKQLKGEGRKLAYWKQNDNGRWEKMQ
ncbi:MAG: DNA polymerase III subunit chi [Asticcacaulis sp.]|uniref:DNA polymerase III subunit chi n=1 Tax=Asticcacaulis sp. TaxID=1872648 RepID=UPI003F7BC1D6